MAMILSSGDPAMYDGAMFSYKGDFVEYLDLEDMGVFTAYGMENGSASKLKELRDFGRNGRVLHGCVIHLRIHVDSLHLQILMPDQHIYQQERAAISTAAPSCWLLFRNIVRASPNVNLNTTIL